MQCGYICRFPLGLRMVEELLGGPAPSSSATKPSDSQIPRLALVCLVAVLIAL
jgi:hypothetical protein